MEEKPKKNKLEDLSPDERQLLVQMTMHAETIEEYILNLNEEFPREQLLALDDVLNESYEEFLPKLDTEKLHIEFLEFEKLIDIANQNLATYLSEFFESFVRKDITLTKEKISLLRSDIERAKNIIIPRLKKLGLNDLADMLGSSIMSLEIKLAYDSGAEE